MEEEFDRVGPATFRTTDHRAVVFHLWIDINYFILFINCLCYFRSKFSSVGISISDFQGKSVGNRRIHLVEIEDGGEDDEMAAMAAVVCCVEETRGQTRRDWTPWPPH